MGGAAHRNYASQMLGQMQEFDGSGAAPPFKIATIHSNDVSRLCRWW